MYFLVALLISVVITLYDWYDDNLSWSDLLWNAIAGLVWPITALLLLLFLIRK